MTSKLLLNHIKNSDMENREEKDLNDLRQYFQESCD